jgi:hypothetical protein
MLKFLTIGRLLERILLKLVQKGLNRNEGHHLIPKGPRKPKQLFAVLGRLLLMQ